MKHADSKALDRLEELLVKLRQYQGLKEKKRGIFYWKSNAFLHFHQNHDQLFADLRVGSDWERFPVNTQLEQEIFLTQVEIELRKQGI
ncbi:hypothetical protein NC981_24520 [Leptolyngbya sp. DQ-M1]|uniref:hypothetical protein n=1 Tax=Leptolyngbya sp. DQ-M1 TaxID=2933920 RepID=UPI003297D8BD